MVSEEIKKLFKKFQSCAHQLGGNTRKRARQTARHQQKGIINQHSRRLQQQQRRRGLTGIVQHRAEHRRQPQVSLVNDAPQQQHTGKAQQRAARAVEQRREIAAEHRAEQQPHTDQQRRLMRAVVIYGVYCHNISQTELHARDGKWVGNLQFNNKHNERYRAQYGKLGKAARLHQPATASAPPSGFVKLISR